jgi:hypothetical protein
VLHAKRPTHKQAHLVLPTHKANAEKPKEPVFFLRIVYN